MWCGFIMKYFSLISLFSFALVLGACGGGGGSGSPSGGNVTATEVEVGKLIFEDTRLSANENQSCASCHAAVKGFADPRVAKSSPVSEGSFTGLFGNRNAPTSAYSKFSPAFAQINDPVRGQIFAGGQFLDGRRNTLEEQAKDPFLNSVEMANADKQAVVDKVQNGSYADKFIAVYGSAVFDNTDTAYDRIAEAIAAFERSDEMNSFTSKFDCYTQNSASYPLSPSEQAGLTLFDNKAKCSSCHTSTPDPVSGKVLFTNFQYINIGVPVNPGNPSTATDLGLGGRLANEGVVSAAEAAAEDGKFKTPTLRNIALTAPYMHNGVYATLKDVIQHYDIDIPDRNITPEVIPNIATELVFDTFNTLGLSVQEYTDLEAFMTTLTDGSGVGICF